MLILKSLELGLVIIMLVSLAYRIMPVLHHCCICSYCHLWGVQCVWPVNILSRPHS